MKVFILSLVLLLPLAEILNAADVPVAEVNLEIKAGPLTVSDIADEIRRYVMVDVEGVGTRKSESLDWKGGVISIGKLTKLVQDSLGYSSEMQNGALRFTDSKVLTLGKNDPLTAAVDEFHIENVPAGEAVNLLAKQAGLPVFCMYRSEGHDETRVSVHMTHTTVSAILDAIVKAAHLSGWNATVSLSPNASKQFLSVVVNL